MSDYFSLDIGQSIRSENGVWYKNIQTLGHGGNAITFLALATSGDARGVLFAIKVFRKLSQPARRDAFIEEIKFLRVADHPSVMRIYDAGIFVRHSGTNTFEYPFVAAEYLPKTLAVVIRENTSSLAEKVSYSLQLLSVLRYLALQDRPVIHRDIKPQNIFVKGGSCVLGDFGLMKFLDGDDAVDRDILKESELPGMPFYYRTPDLISYARAQTGITMKSDVFQLGLVLTELFTGWNSAQRPNDILDDIILDPIKHIGGNFGGGIAALLHRMLELNPDDRVSAEDIMGGWQGVFDDITSKSHELEGRVF